MVNSARRIEKQLGEFNKQIAKPEKKIIKAVRRGVYAKMTIHKGKKVNSVNSAFLRPSKNREYLYIKKLSEKKLKAQRKKIKLFLSNKVYNISI